MSALLDKDVRVTKTLWITQEQAHALGDPLRYRILELLCTESMTVVDMESRLKKEGKNKTKITLRYHLAVLLKAGLVDVSKMEVVRGVVRKFYAATAMVASLKTPENFDSLNSSQISTLSKRIKKLLDGIKPKLPKGDKTPDDKHALLLKMDLLNRALTRAVDRE